MREPGKGTQLATMLQKLKRKKGLTMYEAVTECGTTSPHRRLSDLRQMGYCIDYTWKVQYDKDGKVVNRYKVYRLCS